MHENVRAPADLILCQSCMVLANIDHSLHQSLCRLWCFIRIAVVHYLREIVPQGQEAELGSLYRTLRATAL